MPTASPAIGAARAVRGLTQTSAGRTDDVYETAPLRTPSQAASK